MIITNVWTAQHASADGKLTGTFISYGGPIYVFFAGSAWALVPSTDWALLTVNLYIDEQIALGASVMTNEGESHKALVPTAVLLATIPPGEHRVSISPLAGSSTRVDQNDIFTLTITEFALR